VGYLLIDLPYSKILKLPYILYENILLLDYKKKIEITGVYGKKIPRYCGNHCTAVESLAFKTNIFKRLQQVVYKLLLHTGDGPAALLVGRSPVRSPVVSLGIFSEASDKSMCPGSTQPLEMSTRIFLGVKTAGA
jgi:hypothetical protein